MFVKRTTLAMAQFYADNLEVLNIDYSITVDEWGRYTIFVYDRGKEQQQKTKEILKEHFIYSED